MEAARRCRASAAPRSGRSIGVGANDRARRITLGRRVDRCAPGRRCRRSGPRRRGRAASTASAMRRPAGSTASSFVTQIGSSLAFPLVITSGRPTARSRRWCSGVDGSITPCRAKPGATEVASGPRPATSTIGARHDVRASSSTGVGANHACAVSTSGTITANGLSGRRLRARRRATASSSVASQARWNPPRPFSATISPARSRPATISTGSSTSGAPSSAEARPAGGTGHRLGVEPAVDRVLVLASAVLAHRERPHRRALAVVRERLDDREPRPAVGAVDERVAEPAVVRVEQLRQAGVARGRVRRHHPHGSAVPRPRTASTSKVTAPPAVDRLPGHALDARERRGRRRRGRPRTRRARRARPRHGSRRRRSRCARARGRGAARPAARRRGGSRRPAPRREPRCGTRLRCHAPALLIRATPRARRLPRPAASTSAGSAAATAGESGAPGRRGRRPRHQGRPRAGSGPIAAASPTASASPRPCEESEPRNSAGQAVRVPHRRARSPRVRGRPRRPHGVRRSRRRSTPSSRSSTRQRDSRLDDLDVRREASRASAPDREQADRVVARLVVPAADHAHAGRHRRPPTRARRRAGGSASRTRCMGRSSARPSRPRA